MYPGSFDPITKGHTAILASGLVAFERIIVAVLNNESKRPLFSVAERMELIRESVVDMGADPDRIEVDRFDGLLVNYAKSRGARVETVFIMANDAYFYVASNLVKEVARLGGDISDLVPKPVLPKLLAKFDR